MSQHLQPRSKAVSYLAACLADTTNYCKQQQQNGSCTIVVNLPKKKRQPIGKDKGAGCQSSETAQAAAHESRKEEGSRYCSNITTMLVLDATVHMINAELDMRSPRRTIKMCWCKMNTIREFQCSRKGINCMKHIYVVSKSLVLYQHFCLKSC